jgi:tryptophan synthase beta chain
LKFKQGVKFRVSTTNREVFRSEEHFLVGSESPFGVKDAVKGLKSYQSVKALIMPEAINQFNLPVDQLPRRWYNLAADLPEPLPPPQDPKDGPSRLQMLPKFLLKSVLEQENSTERWIDIPKGIRELYIQAGRPRPLMRALRLEKALKLPKNIRLYYKREDLSPTGSHKVNTALAQTYYAAKEGYEEVTTETGAGQWGSALSYAASLNDLKCRVFWVRAAYRWKPGRRTLMNLFGADVFASPSKETNFGRKLLKENPQHVGSLGIAISEGIEDALNREGSIYCLGSVLSHVLLHQTVIGLETIEQFKIAEDDPTLLVGCFGGGSNFGGFSLPFIGEVLQGKRECNFLAAQSEASPNLVKGKYIYDHGDHAGLTPLLKMYSLGHDIEMPEIWAEGIRYSAAAPIMSMVRKLGMLDAVAYPVDEVYVYSQARRFIQTEGFIPAPESSYAVCAAIDKALEYKEKGKDAVIGFNVSGHGFLDMQAFAKPLKLE